MDILFNHVLYIKLMKQQIKKYNYEFPFHIGQKKQGRYSAKIRLL